MKNKLVLTVVIISFVFISIPVMADQVFLFSDDLSAWFDIDRGQTTAKLVSGSFNTADGSVSSTVVSNIVADPHKTIISARLDVSEFLPSSTRIIYYLSNNNGFRWTQVNPGYTYLFDSAGSELRWKAILARESPFVASAYVDNINITYTVSDSILPATSISRNSYNSVVYGNGGDLQSFVCDVLSTIGLSCGAPQPIATPVYGQSHLQPSSVSKNTSQEQSKQQANVGNLQASIANVTVKRTASDDEVILVKVPATNGFKPTLGLNANDAIFEIIRGQKHFIPTVDIFFDYGFDLSAVQNITHKDLEPFPRAKLVNVSKDSKKTYYITEGYMIRLIPNKNIFWSYGDREEDVITISKKEFNFYPRNQYVFLENPLGADIFQIVSDGSKRYVVPQVMKRLRIKQDQIAPINQDQLEAYKNSSPIIF